MSFPIAPLMSGARNSGQMFAPKLRELRDGKRAGFQKRWKAAPTQKAKDEIAEEGRDFALNKPAVLDATKRLSANAYAPTAPQTPPIGAADQFSGPRQLEEPLLPAPALPNADPTAALNQFANDELGGTFFKINRRRPASRPQRATDGPYRGMTPDQAGQAVENKFRGLSDEQKQGSYDRAQGLTFEPRAPGGAAGATPQPSGSSPNLMVPRPGGAAGFARLQAPQKATGQTLGGTQFTNLQPRQPAAGLDKPVTQQRRRA
jgi:hypothetical protein